MNYKFVAIQNKNTFTSRTKMYKSQYITSCTTVLLSYSVQVQPVSYFETLIGPSVLSNLLQY